MKFLPLLGLAACAVLTACGGSEQDDAASTPAGTEIAAAPAANGETPAANAAESIRTRQQHYKQIGGAMKGINAELKKNAPDTAAIEKHAATINGLAPQIQGWFPDGSGSGAGVKTAARAEIWSRPEEFRRQAQAFVAASSQFHQTAQGGDLAAIRSGVKTLGGSCKSCHDQFRVED